jgi:hypothetical protein
MEAMVNIRHVTIPHKYLLTVYSLRIAFPKGTVSRDFRPLVFSLTGTPGSPDSWAKAVLNMDSNSRSNSIRFVC